MTSVDVALMSSLMAYLTPGTCVSIVSFQQETASYDTRSPSISF